MKSPVIHREVCRLCSSTNVELVVQLAPVPLAEKYSDAPGAASTEDSYPIDLYMCKACGHVQLLDVIDADRLWDDYTYHSGQTRGIVEHFQEVADKVERMLQPAAGSLVIDVGSNDGSLLAAFKRHGHRVLGIDPARQIAEKATANGIPTLPCLMTIDLANKIRTEHGPAAVVTAFNVFAHADDLNGMADAIRIMLGPTGVFLFEAQYLVDILDKLLLGTVFHEHMSHHSLWPMKKFLERHGLQLVDVERNSIQWGSIIGYVQHANTGGRPIQPAVTDLLKLETDRQIDQPATVKQFGVRLHAMRDRMAKLLADWRQQGATVAAYGAARSGPTYIVQLGLDKDLQYILDDHPQKVGKYSPGHLIPVLPTKELLARMPDYVVILAWIHAKKIIANNREYLERGGHFVTCCPHIQVIDKHSPPVDF